MRRVFNSKESAKRQYKSPFTPENTQHQVLKHLEKRLTGTWKPYYNDLYSSYRDGVIHGERQMSDGVINEDQHHERMSRLSRGLQSQALGQLSYYPNDRNLFNIARMLSFTADWHYDQRQKLKDSNA